MDPDLALSVFWRFAVEAKGSEPYVPSAFLMAAVHELHLFPPSWRVRQFCRESRLAHHNEVTFDLFIELYRQLHKEMTTAQTTGPSTDAFLAMLAPPGTRFVRRAQVAAALAGSSSSSLPTASSSSPSSVALSAAEVEAIMDMLDPDHTDTVDLHRLAHIVNQHSPPRVSASRLPLRSASGSPDAAMGSGRAASRSRPSGHSHARRRTPTGTASRRRRHSAGTAADRSQTARDSPVCEVQAPAARVRHSRCGRRTHYHYYDADADADADANAAHTEQDSPHAFSRTSDGFSVLIDPCSTVATTTTRAQTTTAVVEPHAPFEDAVPMPRASAASASRESQHSMRTRGEDETVTVPAPEPRRSMKQRASKACDCCVVC